MRHLLLGVTCATLLVSAEARAFCGFYVSGADSKLFNDATMVVLMRDGTRTVLSMQNNYRGPPENFAMVVPVPVVLQKDNVRTLPKTVFSRMDQLASPRLVIEYEPGECPPDQRVYESAAVEYKSGGAPTRNKDLGVKVEAKFDVEEYQIVILSAKDALGLETWLKENKYKIPEDAAPLLKPYVQQNSKFFVAKVDAKKVKFENGQAVLSPLRFHYDAESFALPVRLGLINSGGQQDLIVHTIAKSRYEVANRANAFIPSNIRLKPSVENEFGPFYVSLLDKTFQKTPGTVVTEFAWQGALPPPQTMVEQGIYHVTCDPCPPPVPVDDPLARYLGADVLPGLKTDDQVAKFAQEATITRLHLRYTKESMTDDLVFKAVAPVAGGIPEQEKTGPAEKNRFQGRYIIRKPFDQAAVCGRWGFGGGAMGGGVAFPSVSPLQVKTAVAPPAPPPVTGSNAPLPATTPGAGPQPGAKGGTLSQPMESYVLTDVPELGLKGVAPAPAKKK